MWFLSEKNKHNPAAEGLSVSVSELINEQKYLPYLASHQNTPVTEFAGDIKSAFKGRGMELEEVREYGFGDDVRDIDWRITARKDAPFTRIYAEEKDRKVLVLLDLSASMVFGTKKELKSVTACKTAALLGWYALKNKDRFGLLLHDGINNYYYKPQNTRQNLMSIIKKISQKSEDILTDNHSGNLSGAVKMLQHHAGNNAVIFILSDFSGFNEEKFTDIAALAAKNKVYCLNIFDILEENAPADGFYEARFGNEKLEFGTYSADFQQEYRNYFAKKREILKKSCQKFSCRYIEIRTDIPIFKQLHLN